MGPQTCWLGNSGVLHVWHEKTLIYTLESKKGGKKKNNSNQEEKKGAITKGKAGEKDLLCWVAERGLEGASAVTSSERESPL